MWFAVYTTSKMKEFRRQYKLKFPSNQYIQSIKPGDSLPTSSTFALCSISRFRAKNRGIFSGIFCTFGFCYSYTCIYFIELLFCFTFFMSRYWLSNWLCSEWVHSCDASCDCLFVRKQNNRKKVSLAYVIQAKRIGIVLHFMFDFVACVCHSLLYFCFYGEYISE